MRLRCGAANLANQKTEQLAKGLHRKERRTLGERLDQLKAARCMLAPLTPSAQAKMLLSSASRIVCLVEFPSLPASDTHSALRTQSFEQCRSCV